VNVTHWTDFQEGGHFAALERGDDLVADIRKFARTL
jgi:microsomal epoxide hydrolase